MTGLLPSTTEHSTELVHLPNMAERAHELLLAQFANKPVAVSLARWIGTVVQWVEDQAWSVIVGTTLDNAVGHSLDQWGAFVGEYRGGLTNDDDYRVFIFARILANRCQGTVNELIAIWILLTAPYKCVTHRNLLPAGQWLTVYRYEWMNVVRAERVARIMRDAAPAGKTLVLVEGLVPSFAVAAEDGTEAECTDGLDGGGLLSREL